VRKLKMKKIIFPLLVLVTFLLISNVAYTQDQFKFASSPYQSTNDPEWSVYDIVRPSLDEVEWIEEGGTNETFEGILNGTWYEFHIRQTFINSNDIFVTFYGSFNWSLLNSVFASPFVSFADFIKNITINPSWWLGYQWYGVPSNRTVVSYWFDETNSTARLYVSFHITYLAEYIVGGQGLIGGWLTGFDLMSNISIGTLKAWKYYMDSTIKGIYYYIYFKAPANVLSQHKDTSTLTLDVYSAYWGQKIENVSRVIEINMPPNTEIQSMTPSNLAFSEENTAKFVISEDDEYPVSFIVVSGPPTKSLGQVVWEALARWVLEPSIWVAFATLLVLVFTGLRGKQVWSRHKTYYRLYRAMVNIHDSYSTNFPRFRQEIDNLSRSVTRLFIEGKITDDQFDKLLKRRDDLIERVAKIQPPPPP